MTEWKEQEWESRLAGDFLKVPDDFEARVMKAVNAVAASDVVPVSAVRPWLLALRRAVLLAGALGGGSLAFGELLAFMFGLWSTTHAF
jgi:hypothetical protein